MSTSYAMRRLLTGLAATLVGAACQPIPYAVAAAQAPAQGLTDQAVQHYGRASSRRRSASFAGRPSRAIVSPNSTTP